MLIWTFLVLMVSSLANGEDEIWRSKRLLKNETFQRPMQGYFNLTELEYELFQIPLGNYIPEKRGNGYQYSIEDVRYIYNKTSQHIEKFRAKGNKVLVEKLVETVKFIELIQNIMDKVYSKVLIYELPKCMQEFFYKLTNRAKLIFELNLHHAHGLKTVNWGKEDFYKIFKDTIERSFRYLTKDPSREEMIHNGIESYNLVKDILDDCEDLEPTNIMSRYIFDGLKLLTRRAFGYISYYYNGANIHANNNWLVAY